MGRKLKIKTKKDDVNIKGNKKKSLCMVLSENKSMFCLWKSNHIDNFSFRKSHYFLTSDATYITPNNIRVYIYLEGISTPLSHKNVETVMKEVDIEDIKTGKSLKRKVSLIKGLKYDSKLIDMLLHKGLFKEFLTNYFDLQGLVIIICIIVIMVFSVINTVMLYMGLFQ